MLSTFHERCLRKIDLEYENGKQLRVTVIKITDSKEDNSIHRLDVSGSTGLRPCKMILIDIGEAEDKEYTAGIYMNKQGKS